MVGTDTDRRIGGSEDLSEVYEKYGKADALASMVGMFAGLGFMVFLSALLAAGAAGITYQLNLMNDEGALDDLSVLGLTVAALVVFASFIVGGFAAGRMARYRGGLNGMGSGLWLLLLVAVFAAAGAWAGVEYNAFNRIDLPNWFAQLDVDDLTTAAIVASGVLIIATLAGGYIGGRLGETYHRRVDAAIVEATRKG